MKPSDYGKYFWCVVLADEAKSRIYAYADQVEISSSGCIVFRGPNNLINLAFQPGQWLFVYVCTPDDLTPVAVQRWPGMLGLRETTPAAEASGPETTA